MKKGEFSFGQVALLLITLIVVVALIVAAGNIDKLKEALFSLL